MAGASIGTAYLTLTPTMKGTANSVKKEMGLVESAVSGSATKSEKSWISKVGGGFAKVAKVGVGAVVGVGAAVSALALKGGISRALSVEDARSSLAGLGNDTTKIDAIMTNALASVKGTAFGLGDAAGVAASAVAAGVAPGQELERVLRLTADAATIAKTDMGDMGQIFNKVAATGKLNGEVVQQLSERGIPVLSGLAEMYGVTADEAQKMVSRGEVSFEDFTTLMDNTLGGAALKSGETFRGAMANMFASFSRAGESIFTPLMPAIQTGMQAITSMMDGLGPVFETAGAAIGEWLTPLGPMLTDLAGKVAPLIQSMMSAGPPPFFVVLGEMVKAALPAIMELAGVVGGALSTAFTALAPVAGEIGRLLGDVLAQVLPIVSGLLMSLAPIFASLVETAAPFVSQILPLIGTLISALLPPIQQIIEAVMPIVEMMLPILASILAAVMPIIENLIQAVLPLIPTLMAIILPLLEMFSAIFEALAPILTPIVDLIGTVLAAAIQILVPILNAVMAVLTPVIEALGLILPPIIDVVVAIIGWLVGILDGLAGTFGFLGGIITSVLQAVASIFGWIWGTIINPIIGFIGGAISALGKVFQSWGAAIGGFFDGIGNAIRGAVNWAIDAVNNMIRGINKFKIDVPSWVPFIGGNSYGFNIPYIPRLAEGATVLPKAGGTLAILAEAGKAESVVDAGLPNKVLEAAVAAIEEGGGSGDGVNLGSGNTFGYTVEELLDEIEKRTKRKRALVGKR